MIWLLPHPLPHSPVNKLDRRHTGRQRKRDKNLLAGEGMKQWGRSQSKQKQERLVLYK
jgi:hypothetical protein